MSRLVEAKVELAEACERRDAADLEFRGAANRHAVGEMLAAMRRKVHAREAVSRLLYEIEKLEAIETAVATAFGPGVPEELR